VRYSDGRYTPESDRLLRCRETTLRAISDILRCGKVGLIPGEIRLRGVFDPGVDLSTERNEIDWLGQKRLSTAF
jgi:hypothetical protein